MDDERKRRLELSAWEEMVEQSIGREGVELALQLCAEVEKLRDLLKKCKTDRELLSHINTIAYCLLCGVSTEVKKKSLIILLENIERLDAKTGG